jgi:glycosyltransferase involved in cell wall biosynthesis
LQENPELPRVDSSITRVLILTDTSLFKIGGIETWIRQIASILNSRFNYRIYVVGITQYHIKPVPHGFKPFNFKYLELPLIDLSITKLISLASIIYLYKLIRYFDIIIIVPIFNLIYLPIIIIGSIMKKKMIIVFQNPPIIRGYTLHNIIFRYIIKTLINKMISACHVLSPVYFKILREIGIKTKIYLIPQGVDVKKFRRRVSSRNNDTFTILFVGRLTWQKGIDILYRIAKMVYNRYGKRIQFLLVGPISRDKRIMDVARKLLTIQNVKYVGSVPHNEIHRYYWKGDVLLLTSRYEGGVPLVMVEAWAAGLPVIASDIPEITWIESTLNSNHILKIVSLTNPIEFVKAIEFYYLEWLKGEEYFNNKYRKECVKNALIFDWDNIVKKIRQMIEEVRENID